MRRDIKFYGITEEIFNAVKEEFGLPNRRINSLSFEEFEKIIPLESLDRNVLYKFFAETGFSIVHSINDQHGEGVIFDMFGAHPQDGSIVPSSGLYNTVHSISEVNRTYDIIIYEECEEIDTNEDFDTYIFRTGDDEMIVETEEIDCPIKFI